MSGNKPQEQPAISSTGADAARSAAADTPGPAQDTRLPPPDVLQGPLAREMGKLLRELVGADPYDQRFIHGKIYAESEYRQWVRRRLREDNFMARIGGGIDMLPDICERLPYIQGQIEKLLRPRTFPAMMKHMAANLEWYLNPKMKPAAGGLNSQLARHALSIPGLAMLIYVSSLPGSGIAPSYIAAFWGMVTVVSLLELMRDVRNGKHRGGETPGSMKYTINAAELYLYLIELYEERPLVPLAQGDKEPAAVDLPARDRAELEDSHAAGSVGELRRRVNANE